MMPRRPSCGQAGVGELQAELRLADARRSDDGRQRARQQPAAQQVVKSVDAGGEARGHCRMRLQNAHDFRIDETACGFALSVTLLAATRREIAESSPRYAWRRRRFAVRRRRSGRNKPPCRPRRCRGASAPAESAACSSASPTFQADDRHGRVVNVEADRSQPFFQPPHVRPEPRPQIGIGLDDFDRAGGGGGDRGRRAQWRRRTSAMRAARAR